MRTSELRELSAAELENKLLDLRKEQFQLRMKKATGSLEKFHRFGAIKITIARIKTILTQKESEVKGE